MAVKCQYIDLFLVLFFRATCLGFGISSFLQSTKTLRNTQRHSETRGVLGILMFLRKSLWTSTNNEKKREKKEGNCQKRREEKRSYTTCLYEIFILLRSNEKLAPVYQLGSEARTRTCRPSRCMLIYSEEVGLCLFIQKREEKNGRVLGNRSD